VSERPVRQVLQHPQASNLDTRGCCCSLARTSLASRAVPSASRSWKHPS
jgi:hypothetical protein